MICSEPDAQSKVYDEFGYFLVNLEDNKRRKKFTRRFNKLANIAMKNNMKLPSTSGGT